MGGRPAPAPDTGARGRPDDNQAKPSQSHDFSFFNAHQQLASARGFAAEKGRKIEGEREAACVTCCGAGDGGGAPVEATRWRLTGGAMRPAG